MIYRYYILILLSFIISSIIYPQGPGTPIHPMTASGAIGISTYNHILFWDNPVGTIYNEVYFSEDSSLVAIMDTSVRIINGYPATVFDQVLLNNPIGQLEYTTRYFWKVVEFDSTGYTEGNVWYFNTKIEPIWWYEEQFPYNLDGWTPIGPNGIYNWQWAPTNFAGGSPGELNFQGIYFIGISYIMSPPIPPYTPPPRNTFMSFNHMLDFYANPCGPIGCAFTTDDGNTWTRLWEISPTGNIGPETINVNLYDFDKADSGNFRIGFYYSGNGNNVDGWYIDNILIATPLTPREPPDFLQAKADTSQFRVMLSWDPGFSPDPISGYRLQRKNGLPLDTSAYNTIIETGSSTLSFNDENVVPGNIYTYRIATMSGPPGGTSGWSNEATGYVPLFVPVELVSFTGNYSDSKVKVIFQTATEKNNRGFEIERQIVNHKSSIDNLWEEIGFVSGHGTTTNPHQYSFTDNSPVTGINKYRLKQIDFDGGYSYSQIIEVKIQAPHNYFLSQNYPNPFNPVTIFNYDLPVKSYVTLVIYDILGKEVAVLVDEEKPAGVYKTRFDGSNFPSGVYFYRLSSRSREGNSFNLVRKLILLK